MARGNLLQGYGQGKLGSTVYSISHGVQVSRAYNPSKYDRKSDSQIIRRAQWIAASQYYSRAIASQFKFAFEDKKPNESYQNAFMKRNWNKGILRSYSDTIDPNCPSVGRFIISQGSLRPITTYFNTAMQPYMLFPDIGNLTLNGDTLGYLSRSLLTLGYRNGDIITYTLIVTDAIAGSALQPIISGESQPQYYYVQFTLDVNSTIKFEDIGLTFYESTDVGQDGYFGCGIDMDVNVDGICAGAIQVSRQTKTKLLVSYAELTLNPEANKAMIYGQSAEWRQTVIDSWKATGTAILQGSDSENATDSSVIENLSTLVFPRTWASMQDKAVVTNKILTNVQFCERIIFYRDSDYIYRGIPQEDGTIGFLPKVNGYYVATAQQDSTDMHRWVFASSNSTYQIAGMYINNI